MIYSLSSTSKKPHLKTLSRSLFKVEENSRTFQGPPLQFPTIQGLFKTVPTIVLKVYLCWTSSLELWLWPTCRKIKITFKLLSNSVNVTNWYDTSSYSYGHLTKGKTCHQKSDQFCSETEPTEKKLSIKH